LFMAEGIEQGTIRINNAQISQNSAIYWDDKKESIEYDETKDLRFKTLFSKNANPNSEQYKKEKALYESLKDDLSKEYNGVVNGKLTRAYAANDIESKKKISELIYAETSSENKTWLERTALGSMAVMFKRWMISKKNLYYKEYVTADENKIAGKREVYQDPETGEWKADWVGRPMEGIFQSLYFMTRDLANTKNAIETWGNLSDYQKRNMKHLATDLIQWGLITIAAAALAADDKDERDQMDQKMLKMLEYSGRDLLIVNTWDSLTGQNNSILALSYVNTVVKDIFTTVYDGAVEQKFSDKVFRNIGLYRNVDDYILPIFEE